MKRYDDDPALIGPWSLYRTRLWIERAWCASVIVCVVAAILLASWPASVLGFVCLAAFGVAADRTDRAWLDYRAAQRFRASLRRPTIWMP